MSHPFRSIVEAAASAARWEPESAKAVIAWYDGLEEMIQACAQTVDAHGKSLVEQFEMDASAGEQARVLGLQMDRLRDLVSEARGTFYRQHADQIQRIENPGAYSYKWDVSHNQ